MAIKYGSTGLHDSSDDTKIVAFDASGITTGNTRTVTLADGDCKLYTGDGTSGQVLTSNGAGAAPTFQDAGAGNLIGLVASNSGGSTNSPTITLENNKDYIILIIFKYDYSSVWNSYELWHASVNGSGVVTATEDVNYAGDVSVVTGTNSIYVHLNNSNYDAPLVMVYEGSTSQIDIS